VTLTPWLVLTIVVAGANWAALLAIRGRWGRISIVLAAAAVAGTVAGNAIGDRTGLELVRIGDFHLVAATIGAQLAMLATLLLAGLLPGDGQGGQR
jgi:Zn-dependent membrane protease YugP